LGAALSKVAGKLFRIGHLGDLNEFDADGGDCRGRNGNAGMSASRSPPAVVSVLRPITGVRTIRFRRKKTSKEEQFYEAHSTGSIQG